jgi:very-short-patch-repair endonuclease
MANPQSLAGFIVRDFSETTNNLLNIEDNQVIELNKVICTLEAIENGVNISQSKYVNFSSCSKSTMQFETITADIILLNRIQEIEAIVESHLPELQSNFEFMFDGMSTNWDKVLSSLDYANKFNSLCMEYSLAKGYISDVCCDKTITEWTIKYSEKLKEQDTDIKMDFCWFADLFDNGEELYDTSIYTILDRIEKSINNLSLLEEWIDFRSIRQQCREMGLSEFVEKVEQMGMQPHIIVDTFFKRFYRLWLDVMIPLFPAVYTFRSRSHQSIINEFNDLDKSQLDIARLRILERLISRLPNTNIATSSVDEVGILKRELTKQRKIMPLRRLFKAIPNLLTALKPCLMMSPLSVSLFLQADGYNFDTVIFDEASQVCTEDAIGAIMRGKQVIIAGDSKQLPPTSFFVATLSDGDFDIDDEAFDDTGAYDSILEEAVNAIPERTLKWHYRSRHEHLIAFSNAKIYNHELITFPSNVDKIPDTGVEYVFVEDGVYDRGGKKHNLKEAKRVAGIVFEHIRNHPNRSLGVVTFSEAQQQAIDSAISQLRLQNSQYEKFFSEDTEHAFFVKNLENVQGDERDTIIFSIGYAKDQNGVMYMNFGPLSRNGGYRRLNVAITRAKYNVKLIGSIHPTDIKVENTNSEGVKMLRQYIEFAINGVSVLQNELKFTNKVDVDSPFEEAVHDFLIKNGYNVTTQVGCSGYRIDMAVKHPTLSGIFVLGIECDGATYHSARTARERDRLRQTVLEDIGWKIYRIWSTDWIKDPQTEGTKLVETVNMAISNYKMDNFDIENIERSEVEKRESLIENAYINVETDEIDWGTIDDNPYNFSYYKETDVYEVTRVSDDIEFLANVIKFVVEQEGPIHFELLCKRVATLFGNQKATVKVRNSVDYVLNKKVKDAVIKKGDFCWHKDTKDVQVKIPQPYGNGRTINYISTEELAEAMFVITSKSFGITQNDLCVLTARAFGFNRTGGNITAAMEKACLYLIESDKVKEVDGKIVI